MKTSVLCSSLVALMTSTDVHGFAPSRVNSAASATRVAASSSDNEGDSRRQFLSQTLATGFTYSAAALASTGVLAPLPANAANAQDKVNARLKSYGLPAITNVPSGMKPLLEVYGKGKNRFPLLVLMTHPFTWVVQLPSNDVNGEDGTIQAGEYAKGDTATFFLYADEGHVDDIGKADKALFERTLIKAISQKGANMYQNFKVTKAIPQTGNPDYGGKDYVLCDFKYDLLTGAGFEVERRGVASVTSEGPAVEVLWAASTRERFKKTETTLRDIVGSFRVYGDGLNFSEEIAKIEERFSLEY
mmetsp:Transcript_7145/g.14609  ORF Transcript_7145/g.14609 Transcript_7145/m.14609 type:complete len:302 (-) Transcript_7145:227-1132(-)|eukprot:CAMPEP_0201146776 /NCGR_PEP_ID=MMETSP0851-20130426/8427_1 /ASSEMBLY_ACC=CAM_ASM_000631 /TAXON_ID=183588 /ORGANISM="Pseudo-nitzschia fraudulenta, Strain WWA7" /LENGTH=301 /DNA_ID=CAMNT_0047422443 /DNA_START=99 /DNA_END=1004 /DNA_ORIENTATION=+